MQAQLQYKDLLVEDTWAPSCTQRYVFKLADIKALIRGPGSLWSRVQCNAGQASLIYRLGDITSILGPPPSLPCDPASPPLRKSLWLSGRVVGRTRCVKHMERSMTGCACVSDEMRVPGWLPAHGITQSCRRCVSACSSGASCLTYGCQCVTQFRDATGTALRCCIRV